MNPTTKDTLQNSRALLAGATLLLAASIADARDYGVSRAPAGRGTEYSTARGGTAYVGPRGVAAQGADGRTAVATPRGAAVAGPNGAAAAGRYGAAAVAPRGAVAVVPGAAVPAWQPITPSAAVIASAEALAAPPLPPGYVSTVPAGYQVVAYGGYTCYYVGGVYYRPVFYAGSTIYLIMQ